MSSIGPQLPPHLQKRSRDPDDDDSNEETIRRGPDSPPKNKIARISAQNADEIDLDDASDSDHDFGPAAPKSVAGPTAAPPPQPPPKRSIGPTMPPQITSENEIDLEDDGDSDDGTGPAPPSSTTAQPQPQSQLQPRAPPKRNFGPAPPPASLSERPPNAPSDSDPDSDDDYGPALATSSSHAARAAVAQQAAAHRAAEEASTGPRRDDWMLAPPPGGGVHTGSSDPTKLKARKFNSGPRANTSSKGNGELDTIWTETPEEKRKRLADAVLGRDTSGSSSSTRTSTTGGSYKSTTNNISSNGPEDQARKAQIDAYTTATRGKSLYEQHQENKGGKGGKIEEEEDDPSKRAFDREKDMKLAGKIGTSQRRELLTKAADFGGRFAKGKFL